MVVRAFALNTKTRAVISEIPFSTVSVTNRLNEPSTWSMSLPVSFTSPNGTEILTPENFDVNFSSVVITRDGVPLIYGLIENEDGEIDEDGEELHVGGPDYGLGYMKRRLYLSSTVGTLDQFLWAQSIINTAISGGATINVAKEPSSLSGVIRTRTYAPSMRKYTYELLSELAAVENGFDFCSAVIGSQAAGFTAGIILGYPQLYRRTGFTLATGKNISKLSYVKDGKKFANLVQVGGSDRSEQSIPTIAQDPSTLLTYVRFDKTESRPTVVDEATLLDHAQRYLRLTGPQGVVEYTVTVSTSDPDCQVGSFRVGDEFQVRINRGRVNVDTIMRVTEWTFKVDEDGKEELSLSLVETGLLS